MRIKRQEVRKEGGVTLGLVAKWGEGHKIINK